MDLATARELLQVGPEAMAFERRAAFDRQRQALEGLLNTAATPALAEHYRSAIAVLTAAFEALEIHHAAASSPALRHVASSTSLSPQPAAAPSASTAPAPPMPPPPSTAPAVPAAAAPAVPAATPPVPTASPAPMAAMPPAHATAPSAPRRSGWATTVTVAAVLAAGAGGAGYYHVQQVRLERQASLTAQIQKVRDDVKGTARALPAALPAEPKADAVRQAYLAARSARRAELEKAYERWAADHPALRADAEAEQLLAGGRLDEATVAVEHAQQALSDPHAAADLDTLVRDTFAQPWWAWIWSVSAGQPQQARWFATEDPALAASCAASIHAGLAALDAPAPIDAKAEDQLAQLAALSPMDPKLAPWRAKLAEAARLRAFLDAEVAAFDHADPVRRDVEAACLERLAALVGAQDATVASWHARLPQTAGALDRLHARFKDLQGKDALPDVADAEILRLVARGLGADDPLGRSAAEVPDRLLAQADAADNPDASVRLLVLAANFGSWGALARLVELQSWDSCARIDPSRLDADSAPASVDGITVRQLQGEHLANWACRQYDRDAHKPDMIRARALMGSDPIASPVVMHEAAWLWGSYDPQDQAQVKDLHQRAAPAAEAALKQRPLLPLPRWVSLLELRTELASELDDRAAAQAFYSALASSLGSDPEYQAMVWVQQGTLTATGTDAAEWAKAEQLARQAVDQLRAQPKARASNLIAALEARARIAGDKDNPQRDEARALELFHQASTLAAQAHMDMTLGWALSSTAWMENHDQGISQAAEDFAAAAEAFGRAGNRHQQSFCRENQSDALIALPTPRWDDALAALAQAQQAEPTENAGRQGRLQYSIGNIQSDSRNPQRRWATAEAAYLAAAGWYERSHQGDDQANCLLQAANCEKPTVNPAGSWEKLRAYAQQAATLAAAAKAYGSLCTADFDMAMSYLPLNNPAGDYATAGPWYSQAAAAAEQADDKSSQSVALHQQGLCTEPDNNSAGSWTQAISLFQRSAELAKGGVRSGLEITLACEAYCYVPDNNPQGSWTTALQLYRDSLELATKQESLENQGIAWIGIARCLQPGAEASASWASSLDAAAHGADLMRQVVAKEAGDGTLANQLAIDRGRLADALYYTSVASMPSNNSSGDWSKAVAAADESATLYSNMGKAYDQAVSVGIHARALRPDEGNLGTWAQAADLYDKAQALCGQAKNVKQQAIYLLNQGVCLYKGNGNSLNPAAQQALQQAVNLAHSVGDAQTESNANSWLH